MSTESITRAPLTPIEKVFFRIAQDTTGDCTCHVSVRVDRWLEEQPLRWALSALQQRHPKLRARLVEAEDGEQFFETCATVPPVPLEVVNQDTELPEVVEDAAFWHQGSLENEAVPLIRVRVYRNRAQAASILVVTIPHALGDGTSQAGVVKDLLAYYAAANRTGGPLEVDRLPLVAVGSARRTGTFLSWLRVLMNRVRFMRAWRKGFVDLPASTTASGLPRCHRWSLSEKQSMGLIRRCRQEDTSIFGAVLAASLLGLNDALDQPHLAAAWRCPIDIRSNLASSPRPLTHEDLGMYCVLFRQMYEVNRKDSFWELARRARQDIKEYVQEGGGELIYNLLARMMRPKNDRGKVFRKLPGRVLDHYFRSRKMDSGAQQKRPTLQVSYVGILEAGIADEELTIRDWSMAVTSAQANPSLMSGAYMMGRELRILFFGFDLADSFWGTYVAAVEHRLRQAIEQVPSLSTHQPEPKEAGAVAMKTEATPLNWTFIAGLVVSCFLAFAAAGGVLALNAGRPAATVVGMMVLLWALVQERKMRRIEAVIKPVSPEDLEANGLGSLTADATAKDLYLDTMKRALMNILYHESSAPMWCTSRETGRCGPINGMDLDRRLHGADFSWNAMTLLGQKRLDNLRYCVESVLDRNVPGDFLEAGAFKGGGCIYMKAVLRANEREGPGQGVDGRRIFVCDTFVSQPRPKHIPRWLIRQAVLWLLAALASIPVPAWRRKLIKAYVRFQGSFAATHNPSDHSIDVVGTFMRHLWEHSSIGGIPVIGTSLTSVRSHFARFGLLDERVLFLQGLFSKTLPDAPIDALAILRVDCDTYESTLDALRPTYDKLSEGGFCIIDDYFEYPDCEQAVQDFRKEKGITGPIHRIDWNGAYWIKGETDFEQVS